MAGIASHGGAVGVSVWAPVYRVLFPVPVVCFAGALVTDIAYARTAYLMWLHFSEWLIAAGLAVGALAALALLIDFVSDRANRTSTGWWHLLLFYAALIAEFFNALVHTIDGWTAVVPTGLALSVVGTVLALASVAAWFRVTDAAIGRWEDSR